VSVAATGVDRIAEAFRSHGKRAALMPYLMGGHPTIDGSI
jgi:tryptophan synthase alpha chain